MTIFQIPAPFHLILVHPFTFYFINLLVYSLPLSNRFSLHVYNLNPALLHLLPSSFFFFFNYLFINLILFHAFIFCIIHSPASLRYHSLLCVYNFNPAYSLASYPPPLTVSRSPAPFASKLVPPCGLVPQRRNLL